MRICVGGPETRRSARLAQLLGMMLSLLMLLVSTAEPVLAGFQPRQLFAAGSFPDGVASADFNSDGKPDLAMSVQSSNGVYVLLSTTAQGASTPSYASPQLFATGSSPLAVVATDVNVDGLPDLLVVNGSSSNVAVLLNLTSPGASSPSFAPAVLLGPFTQPQSVMTPDLNGDSRPDLVVGGASTSLSVYFNTTPPGSLSLTYNAGQTFTAGNIAPALAAADLNADGTLDVVAVGLQSDTVTVLLNRTSVGASSATFATAASFSTGAFPNGVAIADLNGDSRPDLAVTNTSSGNVSVLLNWTPPSATSPTFATQQPVTTGGSPWAVAAVDHNADGKPDLIVADAASNTVGLLRNQTASGASSVSFSSQQTFVTGTGPIALHSADLNGDGRPDLAVANGSAGNAAVLFASPTGSLQFAGATVAAGEGGGTAAVTVTRTDSTDGQVSAVVSRTGGTATQGQDFTFSSPQTVTWADGDGANKTVSVPITQDQLDEPDETVQFTISLPSSPSASVLGSQTTTTLTIADDDQVTLNIAPASTTEGNSGSSTATFTVSLVGDTSQTVTVQYATSDGSAKASSDYTAASGTLTFAPGVTSQTIPVTIQTDTLYEPDEVFTLTLSNPAHAVLGVSQANGVIQNDDVIVACTPRPRVTSSLAAAGGGLQVHVESTPLNTPANNVLQEITFGTFTNATVTMNGQSVSENQKVTLPSNAIGTEFTVRRVTAGQAATVQLTVLDGCGEWKTFVGGGPAAGF